MSLISAGSISLDSTFNKQNKYIGLTSRTQRYKTTFLKQVISNIFYHFIIRTVFVQGAKFKAGIKIPFEIITKKSLYALFM